MYKNVEKCTIKFEEGKKHDAAMLQAPYRNRQLTAKMGAFNKSMSSVQVSVECLFGDIVNYFRFVDFKKT